MAAQVIPVVPFIGPYITLQPTAASLNVAWTTGQVGSGDNIIQTSGTTRYHLLMRNTHASLAQTVTIVSVADPFIRTGDITAYSIAAGLYASYWFSSTLGWANGSGNITIQCSTTDISFMLFAL